MLTNLDFINFAHGIDNTRVYKTEGKFFCYTATVSKIIPFSCLTVKGMSEHIISMLNLSWGNVNIALNYKQGTYSKKKMQKLNNLLRLGDVDVSVETIQKWIVFLL
jgi:hypothetical protein